MTVESAFRQGEFFSIPDEMIVTIGKSLKHEGCGYVSLIGGTCYITKEPFGELAQMVAENAEVE